jgi:hypothetical protein
VGGSIFSFDEFREADEHCHKTTRDCAGLNQQNQYGSYCIINPFSECAHEPIKNGRLKIAVLNWHIRSTDREGKFVKNGNPRPCIHGAKV